jgi:tetratricopeptide (TPR) repeat protein
MVDPDRRPTAQEIEELIDLVRRDPASPAFIDLGEAYLALGRPRDALQVGNVGLAAAPDSLEGRVMLARAHAAMHQWKEAQGELLRVVKADRGSRQGFALLGEVLLRRQDFERAVPVLQHAQNLDPTSPQILAMLKRARAGQALDPPPPLPTPVPPRGETDNGQPLLRSRNQPAMAPTLIPGGAGPPTANVRPRASAAQPMGSPMVPVASPAMPTMAVEPATDWRSEPATEAAPPPSFAASAGVGALSSRPPKFASPPVSVEGVRPRIVQAAKPQNAAAASLRQSAAVGESYLNDLLTGGLLDVAGVRVPDADFDLRPDRRWGRSTRRAFVFLFVVLVLGIGGGGTWYWWSEKQKAEAVARLQRESQVAIPLGDYDGFETCIRKLSDALKKDKTSLLTYAYVAECAGLETLLYGTDTDAVENALKIAREIKPDEPGAREVLIGRAALELSRLGLGVGAPSASQTAIAQVAKSTLAEQRKALDAYAAQHDKDRWVTWLRGRALLAAGERKAGRAMLKAAADDDGLVVAMVDTADLLVDDGQLDDAMAIYDRAAARVKDQPQVKDPQAKDQPAKDHPLIVIGRSLGRAEAAVQNDETIGDLSVKLAGELPSRLKAYRDLALSLADTVLQDYAKAKEALQKATGGKHPPNESRFWARVAWANYARGDLVGTTAARSRIVWFGQGKAEDDPVVQLVDAALLLASGLPDKALALADRLQGVRPQILRVYAYLDLGKPDKALKEADAVLKKSPDNIEAKILREQARMESTEGKERADATEALEKLARATKSKIGRHALGIAHFVNGNLKEAQAQLEQAVAELSDDAPNPLAYRSRTALAEIVLAGGDIPGAGTQLDAALALNSGYFPALGLQAKVVLRHGEPDRALDLLRPVFAEMKDSVPPAMQLTYAEAIGTRKNGDPGDRSKAIEALKKIKDQVPQPELSRAAAAIDPKLPKQLDIPEPTSSEAAKPAEPKRPRRR